MSQIIPADPKRCQVDKPGNGPFTMGGEVGNPRDGYRIRCKNTPSVIAVENEQGEDGQVGRMSMCDGCKVVFERKHAAQAASVTYHPIRKA